MTKVSAVSLVHDSATKQHATVVTGNGKAGAGPKQFASSMGRVESKTFFVLRKTEPVGHKYDTEKELGKGQVCAYIMVTKCASNELIPYADTPHASCLL